MGKKIILYGSEWTIRFSFLAKKLAINDERMAEKDFFFVCKQKPNIEGLIFHQKKYD